MKQITSILIAIIFGLTATAQTIRIADKDPNRPTGANIYPTIQAAVDDADPGDIIYVQPAETQYAEDVNVGIKISIVGIGFIPGFTKSSSVRTINLYKSLDGFNTTSGSSFTGIALDYFNFKSGGLGSFNFNDITFENVSIYRLNHTEGGAPKIFNLTINNSQIGGLYFNQPGGSENVKIFKSRFSFDQYQIPIFIQFTNNLLISNCLIYFNGNPKVSIYNSTNVRFEHNIVTGVGAAFDRLENTLVVNNIFFGNNGSCINTTNTPFKDNVFSNNLVTVAGSVMPPAANGGGTNSGVNNLASGTNPQFTNATVVENIGAANAGSFDYTLQAGSPCIGASTTGENIGPSGGLYPWTGYLHLKPNSMPVITLFGNSGVVPQNQPLKSNIKAKAN